MRVRRARDDHFSNFGSLKSTETYDYIPRDLREDADFSNFGSLKSTETRNRVLRNEDRCEFQQFRLVEEH